MMPAVNLRTARSQDIVACAAILNAWIDETDWMPRIHTPEAVLKHYQVVVFQQQRMFVAQTDGAIAGMMALSQDGFVTALYVSQDFRRHGIGTLLIERAKDELTQSVSLWTFQANAGAREFYRRQGFFEVNRTDGDNDEGLPDILLEWRAQ
jgi:ribosomal protein S18 acetylase RimI-like enzyme